MEEEIHLEKETNREVHMHAKFEGWIIDLVNKHNRLTLFNMTLDLYRLIKYLMGSTITKVGENYGELQFQMEELNSRVILVNEVSY